ncbi:hypothetical protein [Plasticicumulans sp.]|uniref:hypothetical protein n=1 Tax=Plasticicumulans sp. TaxID=2307179 RepID=UPI00394698FB|nr:hypothetical protein [Pseudomonadota bacterium]
MHESSIGTAPAVTGPATPGAGGADAGGLQSKTAACATRNQPVIAALAGFRTVCPDKFNNQSNPADMMVFITVLTDKLSILLLWTKLMSASPASRHMRRKHAPLPSFARAQDCAAG